MLALTPLQSLGDVLRRRRQDLGVSMEELQEQTKIRIRYLEALEDGDWDVLPGDVYARGFVRRYAESVRLDGFELLRAYVDLPRENPLRSPSAPAPSNRESAVRGVSGEAEQIGNSQKSIDARDAQIGTNHPVDKVDGFATQPMGIPVEEPIKTASSEPRGDARMPSAASSRPPRRKTGVRRGSTRGLGGQAAVVIGILIVLGGGYWAIKSGHRSTQTPGGGLTNNTVSNQAVNANDTTPANAASPANSSTGNGGGSGANQTSGNTANSTNPGTGTTNTVQVTAQPFQSSYPPTQTYVVQTTNPLSVTLTVGGSKCWVSVSADGSVVDNSQTLLSGTSKTWSGNQSVNIFVGNPPSISVTVNGQSVTLPPQTIPYHLVFQKSAG